MSKKVLSNGKPVVADYHIFKNLIFARQTLKGKQYEKYVQIYDILTNDMPKPNVVIYLHASLHTLLKRIAMRGREFEKTLIRTICNNYHMLTNKQWSNLNKLTLTFLYYGLTEMSSISFIVTKTDFSF